MGQKINNYLNIWRIDCQAAQRCCRPGWFRCASASRGCRPCTNWHRPERNAGARRPAVADVLQIISSGSPSEVPSGWQSRSRIARILFSRACGGSAIAVASSPVSVRFWGSPLSPSLARALTESVPRVFYACKRPVS